MSRPDLSAGAGPEDLARVFSFLSPEQRAIVQPFLSVCRRAAAEPLFTVGDVADACYLLLSGKVAVKKQTGYGRNSQVVALLSPPAPVGERALAGGGEHQTAVHAVTDAVLLRLATDDFQHLAAHHPEIALSIMGHLLRIAGLRLEKCSARLAHIL